MQQTHKRDQFCQVWKKNSRSNFLKEPIFKLTLSPWWWDVSVSFPKSQFMIP